MDIFASSYFRELQNWTLKEQCTVCLLGHIRGDLFSRVYLYRENHTRIPLAKIKWFTVLVHKCLVEQKQ